MPRNHVRVATPWEGRTVLLRVKLERWTSDVIRPRISEEFGGRTKEEEGREDDDEEEEGRTGTSNNWGNIFTRRDGGGLGGCLLTAYRTVRRKCRQKARGCGVGGWVGVSRIVVQRGTGRREKGEVEESDCLGMRRSVEVVREWARRTKDSWTERRNQRFL